MGKGGLKIIFTRGGGGGGGGTGGGVPTPVTARGSGGALIGPPVGAGAKPQPLFNFSVYIT